MESRSYLHLVCVILITFVASTQAYDFSVGGKDGWVLKPTESYAQWSARNRFIVNDKLVFKGSDSVLVVNKADFDTCSVSNPIVKLGGGDSSYIVDKPGPYYFISGNQSNCQNGQKLSLVVISPRTKSGPSAAPSSPIGGSTPPSPVVTAPSSSPPTSSPPSPPTSAPVSSPPSPPTSAPASPPSGSNLVAPSGFPFGGPSTAPVMAPSGSPSTGPSTAPVTAPSGSPSTGPSSGPGPSGADAPGGAAKGSSPVATAYSGFALGCSLLVSMALLIFVPSF